MWYLTVPWIIWDYFGTDEGNLWILKESFYVFLAKIDMKL